MRGDNRERGFSAIDMGTKNDRSVDIETVLIGGGAFAGAAQVRGQSAEVNLYRVQVLFVISPSNRVLGSGTGVWRESEALRRTWLQTHRDATRPAVASTCGAACDLCKPRCLTHTGARPTTVQCEPLWLRMCAGSHDHWFTGSCAARNGGHPQQLSRRRRLDILL